MRNLRLHAIAACIAALALWSCGKEESAPAAVKKVVEEKVPPYTYPADCHGSVPGSALTMCISACRSDTSHAFCSHVMRSVIDDPARPTIRRPECSRSRCVDGL